MHALELLGPARADLVEIWKFYEEQEVGLGNRCLQSLFAQLEALPRYAGIHARQGAYYRALTTTFPYAIYYRIEGNVLYVHSIISPRRSPYLIRLKLRRR